MKMLSAAAATAVFTLALAAPPASAQWGGANSGGAAHWANSMAPVPRAHPAPFRGYEPGNFPIPGLPAVSGGIDGRIFGTKRFQQPDYPIKPDRPDRPRKRHRDRHDDAYAYGYGIGFGGMIDPDRGYFATGGAAPEVVGGHVRYDYDRGYPYDHYSRMVEPNVSLASEPRERSCQTEWTRGRRAGEQVAVRICRN